MKKTILLVHTGDKANFCWEYWYYYWKKNWPNPCEIETVFLNEKMAFKKDGITTMHTSDVPWGEGLIKALQSMNDVEYIIYQHEDYFLTGAPDISIVNNLVDIMNKNDMLLMKMCGSWAGYIDDKNPLVETDIKLNDEKIWRYNNESPYLISHQTSIWRKDFMVSTIDPNDSPWSHEINGSGRLRKRNLPLFAYRGNPPIPYTETLVHGNIREGANDYFNVNLEEINE